MALIEPTHNVLPTARRWQCRNCTCNGFQSFKLLIQCPAFGYRETSGRKREEKSKVRASCCSLFFYDLLVNIFCFLRKEKYYRSYLWTYFSAKRFCMSFSAAAKNSSISACVGFFTTVDPVREFASVGWAVASWFVDSARSSLDGVVSLLGEDAIYVREI